MCSLNKKEFGDRIKDCLRLEKFAVQRMLISMDMDVTFFREFFGGERNGIVITPAEYNESSPVVVARLSKEAAGEIFGVTKIKNGNRYATFYLLKMVVILYPEEKKAQAWITV
ncbi:hypothetical protein F4779DRAFT_118822 [Xylariaceae sp. FL0662B]|nr:hypothetical protein F4779DRAFT_118822 [Xylariaceae sp. FL0662B]